jgi:glycogen debranching enzyme
VTDDVAGLDDVLAAEGWPYASSLPVAENDPGRFHALFGRDSLITSLQLLPVRPDVAHATLRALGARQGRAEHSGTLEAPGKIGRFATTARLTPRRGSWSCSPPPATTG